MMEKAEEGFWLAVGEGRALEEAPYFSDWLEERGRQGEAEFWREAVRRGWEPHDDNNPTYTRGKCKRCWSWWGDSSRGPYCSIGHDLLIKIFHKEALSGFREFLTREEAYQDLLEAWMAERNAE